MPVLMDELYRKVMPLRLLAIHVVGRGKLQRQIGGVAEAEVFGDLLLIGFAIVASAHGKKRLSLRRERLVHHPPDFGIKLNVCWLILAAPPATRRDP